MANIIEILFRARDAQETAQSAREVARELRGLNEAGQEGADGINGLNQALAQTQQAASGQQSQFVQEQLRLLRAGDFGGQPDVDTSKTTGEIEKVGKAAARTKEQTDGLWRSMSAGIDQVGRSAGLDTQALALLKFSGAALAAGAAIGVTIAGVRASVTAAAEAETAQRRLENALGSMGKFSQEALRDLNEYAAGIQRTTIFSDELALSIATLVAQVGQVSGDKLKELTTGVLDVAAALGRDPRSVAIQVAKGDVAELGLVIDRTLPRAERLDAALAQIQQKFGGSAAAEVNTYAGAVAQYGNAVQELREEIGGLFLPVLTQFVQGLKGAAEGLAGFVGRGSDARQTLAEMIAEFERVAGQLANATNPEAERLRNTLLEIQDNAVRQLTLEVRSADLPTVLEQLGRIDDVLRQSTAAGSQEFQDFIQRLRSAASSGVEVKLTVSAAQAETAAREAIARLRGAPDIEFLLRGTTDFEAARRELAGFKAEASDPVTAQLSVDLSSLESQRSEIQRRLSEAVATGLDPFKPKAERVDIDTDEATRKLAELDEEIARIRARIAESIDETLSRLGESTRREAIVTLRTRIEGAESIDEVTKALADAEQETIAATEAWRNAAQDPALKQIADAYANATVQARAFAETKIRDLIDQAALEQVVQLNRQLREAAAGAGVDLQLLSDDDIRGAENLTAAVTELLARLRELEASGSPVQLVSFYNRLNEIVIENTDKVRANREEMERLAGAVQAGLGVSVQPAIDLERQRREVSELIALVQALQDTAGATTTARIIDTGQLANFDTVAQGAENASRAVDELLRAQGDLLASGDPARLGTAYEALDATLRRAAAGTSNLTAEQIDQVRRLAAEVEKAAQALEPLERAQFIAAAARVDIDTRQIDEATFKLARLQALLAATPEDQRIRVIVEVLQEDIRDAEEQARERGSAIGSALGEGLDEASRTALEAVGTGIGVVFRGMNDDAERTFASIENLGRAMVASLLSELAKLAASSLFKLLLSTLTGGVGGGIAGIFGGLLTSFGKAGTSDLPPVELPAPDVTVPPVPPIDLPGVILKPPAVTVGDVPGVTIQPDVAVQDPAPTTVSPRVEVLDPPPLTIPAPRIAAQAPGAIQFEAPAVQVGSLAPVSLQAPAVEVGALGSIAITPPDVAVGKPDPVSVQPELRLGDVPAITVQPQITATDPGAVTLGAPDIQVGQLAPLTIPAPEATAGQPGAVTIDAPAVTVQPFAPVALDAPAVTVGKIPAVELDAPAVSVEQLGSVRMDAPALEVGALEPLRLAAPEISLGQPDLSVGALDPVLLAAPPIQVGAPSEISLGAPRVTLGEVQPLEVVPRLEVGSFTTPGPAPRLGEAPPPVGSLRDDVLRTSTAEFARGIERQNRETSILRRILSEQPLSRREEIAAAFTPTGTTREKTVIIQEGAVKALDASDFGNYMTVGNGADALADAALEGA